MSFQRLHGPKLLKKAVFSLLDSLNEWLISLVNILLEDLISIIIIIVENI